jgi:hypothetical protein
LLGTIVNTVSIIAGSLIGLLFRGGISEKVNRTMMQAIGLAVVLIGVKTALKTDALLIVILSLAIGGILGQLLRIEDKKIKVGNILPAIFIPLIYQVMKHFCGVL